MTQQNSGWTKAKAMLMAAGSTALLSGCAGTRVQLDLGPGGYPYPCPTPPLYYYYGPGYRPIACPPTYRYNAGPQVILKFHPKHTDATPTPSANKSAPLQIASYVRSQTYSFDATVVSPKSQTL